MAKKMLPGRATPTYRYFLTRLGNTIIIRRTAAKLKLVKSILWKPGSEFRLAQVSYVGGKVLGTISYAELVKRTPHRVQQGGYLKVTRDQVSALKPFMQQGE